ncbi:response regulator [Streptomyces sp. HUAS TT3]|uniref:response regulator n=1 Tax=Streptomyces sp. HUAS TT3 TaxID=3447510 RepID=UPI003F65D156
MADDDAATRRSLERGLRLSGLTVLLAADGHGALALLAERSPDVLVLDVSMPG